MYTYGILDLQMSCSNHVDIHDSESGMLLQCPSTTTGVLCVNRFMTDFKGDTEKSESCQQVGPASKFEADQFNRVAFAWEMLIFMSVSQEVARAIFVGLQDALLSQQALWLHINRLDDHVRACLQEQSTALDLACCLRDRFESKRPYEYTRFWYWHVNFSIIFLHLLKKKTVANQSILQHPKCHQKYVPNHLQRSWRAKKPRRLNFNSQAAAKAKPKASAKSKAAAPTAGDLMEAVE